MIIISVGLLAGGHISYNGLVEGAFRQYGADTLSIRWYTIAAIPFCLIATPLSAYLSGKY